MTAQALAYSLFLAIPAVFLVLLGLFSVFADEGAVQDIVDRVGTVMPAEAVTLLEDSLTRAAQSTKGGILMTIGGFVLALWTTSSAATNLMTGLTSTYDREDGRGFLRKRLIALAIVLALALGSALVLALLVLGPHLEGWIGGALGSPTVVAWVWWTLQWPVVVGGLLFAFSVVLYLGPDVEQPSWELISPGAVTALVAWLAASAGLAVYATYFGSYEKTWGTLSAVIVTLVWLWLTSAALLFGAEVNAEARRFAEAREREPATRARGTTPAAASTGRLPQRADG